MTLPLGSYHIEETKPPYGYIGTPESYDVTFAWDNERNDVVMATSIAKVDGAASSQSVEVVRSKDIVLATAAQCYAEVGNEEYLHQMALAVSVEVCGRLGISPPADAADRLNGLRAHIPAGEERRALEEVREMAKVFGDTVCKELDLQRPRSDLQRTEER